MNKALKAARAKVNALEFGTKEWDAAMMEVKEITNVINDATDFGPHVCHEDEKRKPK